MKRKLDKLSAEICVVQIGGKVKIAKWQDSPVFPGVKVLGLYDKEGMATFYANQTVTVRNGNKIEDKPIFGVWLKHPDSPRANGITMDAKCGMPHLPSERFVNGALNLWTGFSILPAPGKWPLLREHLEKIICCGDSEYLLKWCAWTLQNPIKPSEVAVVMRGNKGAGKGVLGNLLRAIFGAHGLQISSPKHLTGNFNAHLMHCCLLFADEALWAGDKAAAGVLKRIITEPTLNIEPKGVDSFEAPNRLSIIMASNERWVVPASVDERRFCVFDVSADRCKDFDYFRALHEEIYEHGGMAAFLHDMLATELGNWHPRHDIPETKGLHEQQAESAEPEVQWLWSLLDNGELPGGMGDAARADDLVVSAKRSSPAMGYWNSTRQAKFLKDFGAVKHRDNRGVVWRFPPLPIARLEFLKRYRGFEVFDATDQQWEWLNRLLECTPV
jgi:hypothetical protein